MQGFPDVASHLRDLETALVRRGGDLALFLVYDRPDRVHSRPGLERAFFAQRCVSDRELGQTIEAFRSIGAYVELFEGELPFLKALAQGRIQELDRSLKLVYNGIEGGIAPGGFEPGRKALVPCVVDAYGLMSTNSNAYASALGRHKFHYLTLLRALNVRTPRAWHYRTGSGWSAGRSPDAGTKVIAKSTYESWSVGVGEDSVFVVDDRSEELVAGIAERIGQPVTVQEFVAGAEVCVPIVADPEPRVTPPVEAVLAKSPRDPEAVMTIDDNLRDAGVRYEPFEGGSDVVEQLRRESLEAFDVLQLQSFARLDFRVDAAGTPWLIDVGVSPGISTESSAFHSMALLGLDHPSFLRVVIAATLATRGALP